MQLGRSIKQLSEQCAQVGGGLGLLLRELDAVDAGLVRRLELRRRRADTHGTYGASGRSRTG